MADLHDLDSLVADLLADSLDDAPANDELQAALIAALGNAIAVRADGNERLASLHCDRAGIQIVEAATLAATLMHGGARP